jgi:hypothetical protein
MAQTELMPTPKDMHRDMVEDKRELAYRQGDRYEVWLWWVRSSGVVSLALRELNQEFEFEVPPQSALDAFQHPYGWAYRNGYERPNVETDDGA